MYIPVIHKKYDILPKCKNYNFEMIVWNPGILDKIQKLTNMTDHMCCPYQRYKSYEEFFVEIDSWINKFPDHKQEIIKYKNSVIKMNNKDLWAIVQYVGESNWNFTKNKFYYIVMYIEKDSWVVEGIIDNEEYNAFLEWTSNSIDLLKDLVIIIDPSHNLKNELVKLSNKKN